MNWLFSTFIIFLTTTLPIHRYVLLTPNVQQSIHAKPLNQLNKDESGQFTIVIDPGHGGKDQGCAHTSVQEKHITLPVALKIGSIIEKSRPDITVIYTRSADYSISLNQRVRQSYKADLFISVHANAVDDDSVRGFETYVYGLSNTESGTNQHAHNFQYLSQRDIVDDIFSDILHTSVVEESYRLGSAINKALNQEKGIKNRGIRQAPFRVLAKTKTPSVLLELGYLTNKDDARLLRSNSHQELIAKVISAGINEYLTQSSAAD